MIPDAERETLPQWCLRVLGVAVDGRGLWWTDRRGSTHLIPWWRPRRGRGIR